MKLELMAQIDSLGIEIYNALIGGGAVLYSHLEAILMEYETKCTELLSIMENE